MIVSKVVKARVVAQLKKSIALAEAHYNTTFKFPIVKYDKRGTTAGTANYTHYTLDFNSVLLMENIEDFIARTVPHEMAHLIDHKLHPENFRSDLRMTSTGRWKRTKRDVHGRTFKTIMHVMGAPDGGRCHSYDTANARTREKARHEWICNDCNATMKLGPGRHKKQMIRDTYRPRKQGCNWTHTYRYVGVVGAAPVAIAAQAAKPAKTTSPKPTTPMPTKGPSKVAMCRRIYDRTRSRQQNIDRFISGAGCTPAGASSYFSKIKDEFGR